MIRLVAFLLFLSSIVLAAPRPQAPYHGMVVSEHKLASQIGVDILRAGGNAIDAAVAVGYALAVVTPCCGNIGGGGFMTIHFADGKDVFLNFREKAPLKAHKNLYLNNEGQVIPEKSIYGYLAVAVPGTVLGFETALQKYGTMTRAQIMAPAIALAQNGFRISPYLANQIQESVNLFRRSTNISAIFLKNDKPYQSGDLLVQKDLAHTLSQIAATGADAFYRGPIAQAIVHASNANGGILSLEDFAAYNVEILTPLYCQYRSYQIISAPPPSSGGITLCEMLNILENFPLRETGYHTRLSSYYIIETMRYGFQDRNTKLGDPNFVNNPTAQLISKTYAKEISQQIQNKNLSIIEKPVIKAGMQTTHYSVLDKYGNAVSVTYTLNGRFGAGVIAGDTGFFLNNQMDDFASTIQTPNLFGLVQTEANTIQGGKRPLSSITPTIVLKEGKLFLVIGSPGGPRIITSVLLSLLNVIDYDLDLQTAINAPRFHYQGTPDWIDNEPFAFSFITAKALQLTGYRFSLPDEWGAIEAIQIDKNGQTIGASDPRRPDGAAIAE